jgi:hypothetical protein
MVKGRYVGQIIINFCFDENQPGMKPFEQMRKDALENFNAELEQLIADDAIVGCGTVKVEQQYLDLYLCEGGKDNGQTD